jgi:YVTN family beta-propeller protein
MSGLTSAALSDWLNSIHEFLTDFPASFEPLATNNAGHIYVIATPAFVPVDIDIKPGGDPNSVNCTNENGVIPVAILTTPDFDATTVDHASVTFEGATELHVKGGTGLPRRHEEDVDGDGDIDLVFHFRYGDTALDCSSTGGSIEGRTFDGVFVRGDGSLNMVGNELSTIAYMTEQSVVAVLDAVDLTVLKRTTVGVNPRGLAVTPDGKFLYVTNFSSASVSIIDTDRFREIDTVPVGKDPCDIAITPDGAFAYVVDGHPSTGGNTVSVIETATNTVVATIPVGWAPRGIAITPDGGRVLVTNYSSNSVSVIATATNTVVHTIPVWTAPIDVEITPDGSRAYVSNAGSNTGIIYVIDLAGYGVIRTIPLATRPRRLDVTPDGSSVYIAACTFPTSVCDVVVLDTATETVAGTIPMGSGWISDLAVTPDGTSVFALAGSSSGSFVRVIDTASNSIVDSGPINPAGRIVFP